MSELLTGLAGLSLLLDPGDSDCVLVDSESEEESEGGEEGPRMERTTGSNTRPWKRPNTTVRLNT